MKLSRFHSYYWKTLSIIGVVSVGFLLIVIATLAYYMVIPLGKRATDDLASVITHAAETWDSISVGEHELFVEKMRVNHELVLTSVDNALSDSSGLLP